MGSYHFAGHYYPIFNVPSLISGANGEGGWYPHSSRICTAKGLGSLASLSSVRWGCRYMGSSCRLLMLRKSLGSACKHIYATSQLPGMPMSHIEVVGKLSRPMAWHTNCPCRHVKLKEKHFYVTLRGLAYQDVYLVVFFTLLTSPHCRLASNLSCSECSRLRRARTVFVFSTVTRQPPHISCTKRWFFSAHL